MKRKKTKLKVYMTNIKADENYILVTDNLNNVEKMVNNKENFEIVKRKVYKQTEEYMRMIEKSKKVSNCSSIVEWLIISGIGIAGMERDLDFTLVYLITILTDTFLRLTYEDYCLYELDILNKCYDEAYFKSYKEWEKDKKFLLPEEVLNGKSFVKYLIKKK